jgi:hypothetical protein
MINNNIILIGPLATGKSTIAAKLSEITGLLNFPIDKLKWYYRFKNGYNLQTSTDILVNKGFEELIVYVEAFFGTNELKSILNEFEGIIDLGATDSYCDNLQRMRELKSFFHDFPNIFLIMPSKNKKKSKEILDQRLYKRYEKDPLKAPVMGSYMKMNEKFINSNYNRQIAKHVIYTADKSIETIAQEILKKSQFDNYERRATFLQRVS